MPHDSTAGHADEQAPAGGPCLPAVCSCSLQQLETQDAPWATQAQTLYILEQ